MNFRGFPSDYLHNNMKEQKQGGRSKTVYKCDSRNCKANGYHAKDDLVTVTLKLVIGKGCPLDFEEAARQTGIVEAVREASAEASKPTGPVEPEVSVMKMKKVVPMAFRGAMQPPPGMKLT